MPAWFGVGYAIDQFLARIQRASDDLALLQTMAKEFPLFIDLLRNVEMALGKADLGTARLYSTLVKDGELRERIYDMFEAEFHRTRARASRRRCARPSCSRPTRCSPTPSSCATPTSIPCT